jgi:cytochrome c oxidase assembly factor CtaG
VNLSVLLALAAAGLAYGFGAAAARPWPAARTASFAGGLVVLGAALGTPLATRAEELLSVHMAQHMLVALVAAPALVAGAPVTVALRALHGPARRRLAGLLHTRALRVASHPACGLLAFSTVQVAVHVPAVYEAALASPALHALEHAAFLWSAIWLWAPLIAADPLPHRPGAVGRLTVLLAAMGAMTAVGGSLAGSADIVYATYGGPAGALGDQALAGAIMWVGGLVVVLPAVLILAWSALILEERRARAREAAR